VEVSEGSGGMFVQHVGFHTVIVVVDVSLGVVGQLVLDSVLLSCGSQRDKINIFFSRQRTFSKNRCLDSSKPISEDGNFKL
jgi:hypothetical protein